MVLGVGCWVGRVISVHYQVFSVQYEAIVAWRSARIQAPTTVANFEAQSHGLGVRCLRFMPPLLNDDARLASGGGADLTGWAHPTELR